jgi:superfamily II DNA helicase RecQ
MLSLTRAGILKIPSNTSSTTTTSTTTTTQQQAPPSVLIYCATRANVESITLLLKSQGFRAAQYVFFNYMIFSSLL